MYPNGGPANSANDTGRIEAFSDGVFAIAITLLVIEIWVPHIEGESQAGTMQERPSSAKLGLPAAPLRSAAFLRQRRIL